MRVSKKVRRIACELLSTCAALCLAENRMVMLGELTLDNSDGDNFFWDEELGIANVGRDLYTEDQIGLLAALAFRECDSDEKDPILRWAEMYAEAEARLREGWTPKGEG